MALPQLTVGKALDVGCGTGRNALYLRPKWFSGGCLGCEPSEYPKIK